jgi:AraC-like DNA-binding protein
MNNNFLEVDKDELVIEVKEIKRIMDLLSSLFPIRSSFIYAIDNERYTSEIAGSNGDYQDYCRIVQQELKHKCIACDRDKFQEACQKKRPLLYRCYNGLYEMFLPLYIDNLTVGYLHFGQVRAEDDFKTVASECALYEHSQVQELEKIYNKMAVIPKRKLFQISELFKNYSDIIIQNKLIRLRRTRPEFYLKKYIEENLANPITVKTAAEYLDRSPSFVTHKFTKLYGKTFHEYLYYERIEYSKKLLMDKSISDVYLLCGFNNRFHFSKVFKKITGMTPHEYQSEAIKLK